MKVLVPNLGSTSLEWRLFDFSTLAERPATDAQAGLSDVEARVPHKAGFERVTDDAQAVEDGLAQLVSAAGPEQRYVTRVHLRDLERPGIVLDEQANASTAGREGVISARDSTVNILVIPTNEELVVAREARRLLTAVAPARELACETHVSVTR